MTGSAHTAHPGRHSTLFVVVVALFVTDLIISNVIAVKAINIFGHPLQAADLIFPITYILGDVLTEVYGYARARRAIWIGFGCNLFAVGAITLGQVLPSDAGWTDQAAYEAILGSQSRILAASFAAYLVGEFVNSYILAKMKVWTKGRFLWARTIGSTIFGQGCDTAIFLTIAFYGDWPTEMLTAIILNQWLFKVGYETLATPVTYLVVNKLKRAEGVDFYDTNTHFSPFAVKE
ncbi:queuosine precursor transporter [Dongia sp.]|uniref:queuosine precursor transporter n=1 Tax=Dongia sp. TaxID=1977262 RepID=UPI0035B02FE0